MMRFKIGDVIVHAVRGAGVVLGLEERGFRGGREMFYRIQLVSSPRSRLLIPVSVAEEIGLRRAISRSKLEQVWGVLLADPTVLPADHRERYELLTAKLDARDVLQVAEVVRDVGWRRRRRGGLTTRDTQMYRDGMMRLAGEIAVVQDIELVDAESEIEGRLDRCFSLGAVAKA